MEKNAAYYISKGFEPKMAEYFASGRKKITGVVPEKEFSLLLHFDNGETRRYDVRPLLRPGTVFAPLCNWETFRRVYLDENHCVAWDIDPNIDSSKVWSNKIDLCPDGCYVDSVPLSS